uniref:Uncharacterized protein n=1 Tax=Anopheles merus TaxID=30066 RepID=A0A182VLH5_ANOME
MEIEPNRPGIAHGDARFAHGHDVTVPLEMQPTAGSAGRVSVERGRRRLLAEPGDNHPLEPQCALGPALPVQRHRQRVRIVAHQRGRPADPLLGRDDGAAALEHRHLVAVDRDRLHAGAGVLLLRVPIVPPVALAVRPHREVHVAAALLLLVEHGRDQQLVAEQVLMVDRERVHVRRIVGEQRPHDRQAAPLVLVERGVPERQQPVALPDRVPYHEPHVLREQPRFAPLRVDVGVRAEERLERARLIPAREQLAVRVAEEAADVRTAEADAGDRQRQAHLDRGLQVAPLGHVVAGPDRRVPLAAGKVRPGQNERTQAPFAPPQQPVERGDQLHVPVQVVHVPVLQPAVVQVVLQHRHLRPVKDGRLVHVVPDADRVRLLAEVRQQILVGVVAPGVRVEEVHIAGRAGPAPAFVVAAILVLHVQALVGALVVEEVAAVPLDVRIDDDRQVAPEPGQVADHLDRMGELVMVPGEVPLAVRVLDVQPHRVHRDVVLVELGRHHLHVPLVVFQRHWWYAIAYSCGSGPFPVSSVYWRNASIGPGPSSTNTSMMPLSEMKLAAGGSVWLFHDTRFTSDDTTSVSRFALKTSTHVSAAFSQKTPAVAVSPCPYTTGTEPYSAIPLFSSYSNTSRLYSRYGSVPLVAVCRSANESACSGTPNSTFACGKVKSSASPSGPFGFESWCDLKFSSHAPGSSSAGAAGSACCSPPSSFCSPRSAAASSCSCCSVFGSGLRRKCSNRIMPLPLAVTTSLPCWKKSTLKGATWMAAFTSGASPHATMISVPDVLSTLVDAYCGSWTSASCTRYRTLSGSRSSTCMWNEPAPFRQASFSTYSCRVRWCTSVSVMYCLNCCRDWGSTSNSLVCGSSERSRLHRTHTHTHMEQ